MSEPRYACGRCGTWTCSACGWSRPGASALYPDQACIKCPSREGTLIPTMHTERMWRRHNGTDPLPEPYAYGERPQGDHVAPFGRRTASTGPEFYRGVRVPVTGPYARLDIESFKRGVDAALETAAEAVVRETRNATGQSGTSEAWDLLNRHAAKLADQLRGTAWKEDDR